MAANLGLAEHFKSKSNYYSGALGLYFTLTNAKHNLCHKSNPMLNKSNANILLGPIMLPMKSMQTIFPMLNDLMNKCYVSVLISVVKLF